MVKSRVMLIALVILSLWVASEAQVIAPVEKDISPLLSYRYCVPTCTNTRPITETLRMAEEGLKNYPEIAKEVEKLQAMEVSPVRSILPIQPKCPCESQCVAKYEKLYYCNGCRIIWPRWGIPNTACERPNSYCRLGCGCPGRCKAYGPRYQTVVLYCPRQRPPYVIKKVRTCTNCCCLYSPYWPIKTPMV